MTKEEMMAYILDSVPYRIVFVDVSACTTSASTSTRCATKTAS